MRCNARCSFCAIWKKEYQKQLEPEMTTAEIKHIIDDLARLHITMMTFTGGEPTLRSDLSEIIDYASNKGLFTSLSTNGFYLYDLIKANKLKNLDWILISIDWPDAERHDRNRHLPVFDRAIKGIKVAKAKGIKVIISTVITKESLPYMEDMCKFAQNINCMIKLLPCEDIIRDQKEDSHFVNDINDIIPDLHQYAEEIRRLEKNYPNLMTERMSASIIEAGGFGYQTILHCMSAQVYINIRYNGFIVFPCKIHPLLSVDIRKKSVFDVYYSKEAREIMLKRDSYPFCKGCRLGCAITASMSNRWATLYEKYLRTFFKGNFFK
jgi:MoaA/NifB/PqqE/SkfB family radical SAM enzyme